MWRNCKNAASCTGSTSSTCSRSSRLFTFGNWRLSNGLRESVRFTSNYFSGGATGRIHSVTVAITRSITLNWQLTRHLTPEILLQNIVLNLDSATQPTPTQSELTTLDVTSVTDGVIPINVIDASALNVIPYDAQVICVNCQRMFPDCHSFDSHQCSDLTVTRSDVYENKNLTADLTLPDLTRLKRFTHKKPLQVDLAKIEDPKQYRCEYCEYTSSVEERFRKHLLVHPNLSSKICKYCFKLFKKPSDLVGST